MLSKAKEYFQAGLCVLPARRDLKIPILSWKPYQQRLPTEQELVKWLSHPPDSLCLITGKVSGNLEMIDFDNAGESFVPWVEKLDQALLDKLVIERSQSGGWHVVYRYENAVNASMKLAMRPEYDIGETFFEKGIEYATINGKRLVVRFDKSGKKFVVILLIETRGEGGLFLCDPSPGYEIKQGDFTSLPVITQSERDILLSAAWEFNQPIPETGKEVSTKTTTRYSETDGRRPGDEFNYTADVRTLLKSHGWVYVETKGDGNECWRRPGKENGISATLRHVDGHWQFYVFSSNAYPFEQNNSYSAFAVYTMLEHNGDFELATRTLGTNGYGHLPTPEELGVDLSGLSTNKPIPNKRKTRKLNYMVLEQIERSDIKFLWQDRFVKGKLNLIGGEGSAGKTWLMCAMCAIVSSGKSWPDGSPCDQGGCIFFTSEDGASDTILPRIQDQGGDLKHIYLPTDIENMVRGTEEEFAIIDTDVLEMMVLELEEKYGKGYVKLIILDPVTAFMGLIDEFKNNQVRAALRPIVRLADQYGFTILGVGHPRKGAVAFGSAAEAWSGSSAYVNAARMVWNVYHDKVSNIRRMLASKFNLIEHAPGLEYTVRNGVVHFINLQIDMSADDYLDELRAKIKKGKRKKNVSEVEEWLYSYLKDGPKHSGDKNDSADADTVFAAAKRLKFGRNSVYDAAKNLGIIKRKLGLLDKWVWELPGGETSGELAPDFEEWNG